MATGELADKKLLFINIYAPAHGAVRVQFIRKLNQLPLPEDVDIICGGDFNCVQSNGLDRVGGSSRAELGAKELESFTNKLGLWDAGYYNMPEVNGTKARGEYAATCHTHFHTAASGKKGSSRLDRFYVGTSIKNLVRGIETEEAQCRSDHRSVLLELHSPKGAIRVKRRTKLYPAPAYVQAATRDLVETLIGDLAVKLENTTATESPAVWGQFKQIVKTQMTKLKKAARSKMTKGFRQRIKRIKAQLEKCDRGTNDSDVNRTELLEALNQAQEARRMHKRRILVVSHAWSSKASTKRFFRRVCNKYGDNTIPTLVPRDVQSTRVTHDKANILADSWAEIFNGEAEAKDTIDDFIAQYSGQWSKMDMSDLDDEITEEEVAAAIAKCKPGKACGPDELGNEWYRDHGAQLVPILTRLFNDCMEEGHTPSSFLEAYIFSISKGGDTSNPLNYRPIALLNTDYKILTRILAWRVRKYIADLVNQRQCGFVPGRTIHEVIDLLEAAKETCKNEDKLSEAQVLLLDFAKAYDSLDRDFLLAILKAKGFPPKFCKFIKATHENTTVQFMANGQLSDKLQVTSGIRQGCPLAPLLFIIAVDILYDVIETEKGLKGITLEGAGAVTPLKVSGYADDTAIYIAHKRMQATAILAVKKFSAVSGLKLNVQKSVAIDLGMDANDGEKTGEQDDSEATPTYQQPVESTTTARYLGHIAGAGDTIDEAWNRAFAALRVRLVLAEAKTNTAQQRAAIAAAIIIPKMLYVARHAWPNADIIKRADLSIRNYVWKSAFAVPDKAPAGWTQSSLAQQIPSRGGVGVPDIRTELMAMSATVVGKWALTQNPQQQWLGDIIQTRDIGDAAPLVPYRAAPKKEPADTLWGTGRSWTELYFYKLTQHVDERWDELKELRAALRFSKGVQTRWTTTGLQITCGGQARQLMSLRRSRRHTELGECSQRAIKEVLLTQLWIGDAQGVECRWGAYKHLYSAVAGKRIKDVMEITYAEEGYITFQPITHALPMSSGAAHAYRELCLNILANFPELIYKRMEKNVLHVAHSLEDKHHVFTVEGEDKLEIEHTWGGWTTKLKWNPDRSPVHTAIANFMETAPATVWVSPHPRLTRMCPLWAGRRRWTQSRKRFKALMNTARDEEARAAKQRIQQKLKRGHKEVAKALETLTWGQLQKMEGVLPYHTQNIMKLKLNRLRLWAGAELGYRCPAAECALDDSRGTVHLAWLCRDARLHWDLLLRGWGTGAVDNNMTEQERERAIPNIFGFRLRQLPEWLTAWGCQTKLEPWEDLRLVALEMWRMGVAVILTQIWRWNVDRIHPDGRKKRTLHEALKGARASVTEAYTRYRLGLYPLTKTTAPRLRTAEFISLRWAQNKEEHGMTGQAMRTRVGFFDGGSRGNPGPGGSGSVIIEMDGETGDTWPIWAAATALGRRDTTNNLAEFIGLHRLLAHAVAQDWKGLHVVGDSAMILRMVRTRKRPKAKKLQSLFNTTSRLADICRVESWSHHYREHNKMADWLANVAMDNKKSMMITFRVDGSRQELEKGLETRMEGDMRHWEEKNTKDATAKEGQQREA